MTFARSMRFSTMADRMLWPQSLARDRLTKRTQSRVVGLRLVSSLVMKHYYNAQFGTSFEDHSGTPSAVNGHIADCLHCSSKLKTRAVETGFENLGF